LARREALALGQPVAFGAGDDVNPEPCEREETEKA
jgi:hypothetical protein